MSDQRHLEQIQGREVSEPIKVEVDSVVPSHGLYQPSFNLSEADYLRLKQSSPALTGVGGAILAFGLSFSLPLGVNWIFEHSVPSTGDLIVAGVTVLLGAGCLVVGLLYSRERRRVKKRIDEHFENNPAELEYRLDDQ